MGLHFDGVQRQAGLMDVYLLLTHLAAAAGGTLIGWSICRRRVGR